MSVKKPFCPSRLIVLFLINSCGLYSRDDFDSWKNVYFSFAHLIILILREVHICDIIINLCFTWIVVRCQLLTCYIDQKDLKIFLTNVKLLKIRVEFESLKLLLSDLLLSRIAYEGKDVEPKIKRFAVTEIIR